MGDPAIQVDRLTKRYRLGQGAHGPYRYRTLRDALTERFKAPFRRIRSALGGGAPPPPVPDTIEALKEVSFTVSEGEAVGIVGRNGSGKSTLLKILSRITMPTEGQALIRGRVGSLLEVGTGFHPELTGRENIFLSGAILGMRNAEIRKAFDGIVAFAEIEPFLDTPVKRYSSGMYLRLAFAVAAHLEPDILLVDEVLAVGDVSFQRKCLNKMQDVGREGRTVLFVSHNMPAVARLCSRAILLDGGRLLADGPTHKVISRYLQSGVGTQARREWTDEAGAPGDGTARLRSVTVRSEGTITETVDIRKPMTIEMEFDVLTGGVVLVPNLHVINDEGATVFITHDCDPAWRRKPRPAGRYRSTARIPGNLLAEGLMMVSAAVSTHDPLKVHFFERDAVAFQVVDTLEGDSARADYAGHMPGVVRPLLDWTTEFTPAQP